jgi:hypothetical protein
MCARPFKLHHNAQQLGLNKKVLMSVITEVVAGFGVASQGLGVVPLVFLGVVAVCFRVVGFGFAVGAAVGLFEVGAAGFRVVAFGFGVVAAGFRVDAAGFEVCADSCIFHSEKIIESSLMISNPKVLKNHSLPQ